MYYLIDGYNLLFHFFDDQKNLQKNREKLIEFFHTLSLSKKNLTVIFDGTKTNKQFISQKQYAHFEVLFTPKGQTADEYILFRIETSSAPSKYVVVSSDRKLTQECKHLGAKTLTNSAFLKEKSFRGQIKKKTSQDFQDTPKNIERLLKIFEKKLSENQ